MSRFDVELFTLFEEIYKTKSITRTAENLGIAQPTVSIALSKLRQQFGDPLFSRTPKGMEPTPFAQEIISDVREIVAAVNNVLRKQSVFNPLESTREFKIAMTGVAEIIMLPALLNQLRIHSPNVRMDVVKMSLQSPALLSDGEIDLAIGFLPHLESGVYQQKLFGQSFVCIAAADHPRIHDTLSLDQFTNEHHVMMKNASTGRSVVDRIMVNSGIQRKVAVRLPSYLDAVRIVSQTELIATVPERLGAMMTDQKLVRSYPMPLEIPRLDVKSHWHERFHLDPGNRWLRRLIARVFTH